MRVIPNHSEICFKTDHNNVVDLVRCKSVKNQSDSFQFNSNESEPIFQFKKIQVQIDPKQIFNPNHPNLEFIQIGNSVYINPSLD